MSRERLRLCRRLQQICAPLGEDRCNLIGVLLRYKFVETGLNLAQNDLERPVASVMRMYLKVCFARRWTLRRDGKFSRSNSPERSGNQRDARSLTKADEKLPPAQIDGTTIDGAMTDGAMIVRVRITRLGRFACPAQNVAP
jgi:hypothetical protein